MSDTKRTPTWYATPGSDGQGIVIDEETGRNVAVAYDDEDTVLLAAAPELLTSAEGVLQIWDDLYSNEADPEEREAWNELRAAISKAKGGEA